MTNENMLALRQLAQKMDAQEFRTTREIATVSVDNGPSMVERVQNLTSRVLNLRVTTDEGQIKTSGIKSKRQAQLS